MLYGGSLLMSFSLFMLSLAQPGQLYQVWISQPFLQVQIDLFRQVFLAQGIGLGLGSGLTYLPTIAIVSHHFKRRESLAMIVVVSGAALGAVVHPILLNKLFALPRIGFRTTVQTSAAMVSGLLVIACLLIRERRPSLQVEATGKSESKNSSSLNILDAVCASLRDAPFMAFSLSLTAFSVGIYYPIFYLQLDAVKHGVEEGFAFYILTIMNGASLVGGLVPCIVISQLGTEMILVGSAVLTAASVFAMLGLKGMESALAIAIVYGLFVAMPFTLQGPIVSMLTPEQSKFGTRLGIAFTFCAFGALVGPPIHGALLSDAFEWWKPAVFSGTFTMLSAVGFSATVVLRRRKVSSAD
ncbi:hypothetical protein NMY22_g9805 [Coprinellus aureogranulatus]|nr:hypothetical protein NMY22_g9805 [Coprinellus aureogranulatus]